MRTISMDPRWSACLFIVKLCSLLARVYRCVVGKPFLALRLRVGAATRLAGTKNEPVLRRSEACFLFEQFVAV